MSQLVMVDTCAWIHSLRANGDAIARAKVQQLLSSQTAAWCEMVRLELWSGVKNDAERQKLELLDNTLHRMPISSAVWSAAANYGSKAGRAGLSIPATDLLIFACAKEYGLAIEHVDKHYVLLEAMK